ncbi:hypothetical protein WJX72_009066 [[Myrmecia] bisecta]|uniref:CBS domain-containing protein n=1 Tax=[Myrmecia] bisecta TaxID=41462 RepID=A0AAW1QS06_9CHLO
MPPQGYFEDLTVRDCMTSPVVFTRPEESIFSCMERMVDLHISGMPVVDETGTVIGVVSGYDLLAVDITPGRLDDSDGFFPPVNRCQERYQGNRNLMWAEFNEMRKKLAKATGRTVGEVMHDGITIKQDLLLTEAANIIVRQKLHRLPVVDDAGTLVGMLSRGDVMQATIENYKFYMESQSA